jgi:hypothetical protein
MTILKICVAALGSALASALFTVWLMSEQAVDEPTIPYMMFSEVNGDYVIQGAWRTVKGYNAPGTQATEIHCNKARMTCVEALGELLIHTEGQDLSAEAFEYRIEERNETSITALAITPMYGCLQRKLSIQLQEKTASLSWEPTKECTDGDIGQAVLIGDLNQF